MKTKCVKCGFESEENLEKFRLPICNICFRFSPNSEEKFKEYVSEKINSQNLESFRKFSSIGNLQKKGMIKKAEQGSVMSRAPFGYTLENGILIPAENWQEVPEIFEEFLNQKVSLRKLAEKHSFSVNGLKKILKNFTYIGKVKFNNQIHDGKHKSLVSTTLFNHVQNKMRKLERRES